MIRSWLFLIFVGVSLHGYTQTVADSTTSAKLPNELIMRMGYASQVVYAGRTLGVHQFGLSPSLAYYHRSGFFSSIAGNYYSADEPRYALTTFAAGYSKDITDKLNATLTFDHLSFTPTQPAQPNPLTNGVDAYLNYDFGILNATVDYSHYWGQQTANQFSTMVSGFVVMQPHKWLDKIILMPSVSGLWGSDNVVFSQLRPAQPAKKQKAKNETVSQEVSGLLDYELTLPVRVYKNNFRFLMTYHYVLPHALSPNEGDLKPIGYLTASLSYVLKYKH